MTQNKSYNMRVG